MCIFNKSKDTVLKLRKRIMIFFLSEIKYLGHIIDKDGRQLDPDRDTAIKDMLAPDNDQVL